MKERDAFLWPHMFAAVRSRGKLPDRLIEALIQNEIDCFRVDEYCLLADISYLQNEHRSTASAVAGFQLLLNQQLSAFSYALGIGCEAVGAYYAASLISPGQEKWLLPWQLRNEIEQMPVSVLVVMDRHMPEFFRACHMTRCGELLQFSKNFLAHRFGYAGQALWLLLRGKSQHLPVQQTLANRSLSWQLSLPVRTLSRRALSAHAWRLYSSVNRALDVLGRQAGVLELGCRSGGRAPVKTTPVVLGRSLKQRKEIGPYLEQLALNQPGISHLQITASSLFHPAGQLELF